MCNSPKGSDLATVHHTTADLIPLFNPRSQPWHEHFRFAGAQIVGITIIGEVTVRLLRMNDPERMVFRQVLYEAGRYPPDEVR